MNIPKEIKLQNQTISIVYDDNYCTGARVLGEADINHNIIKLAQNFEKEPVPKDRQFHVLCHELAHVMLYMTEEKELYKDEETTNRLGTVLEDLLINNKFR